jgi:hypothetical protein
MSRTVQVFGCRNPNATVPVDPRQYMFWAEDNGQGVILHEVVFDGQYDYMNTEPIRSPIPSFEHYKSLIAKGWIPMTSDELKVHFPNMNDRTWVGVPSRWHPIYILFWCCNKLGIF